MVGGCISRHFGWVRNPSEAIFLHIFGVRKKIKKKKFPGKIGKNRFLSVKIGFFRGKIGFYRKNRRFFADFFFSDFSTAISFPGPPISDFSPKNPPISAIFCSLGLVNALDFTFFAKLISYIAYQLSLIVK